MSIEKLSDESKTTREKIPFTQISNTVINNIKNGDAFLVWAYLLSKTRNWKVIKQDIKNNYGFGDLKIKKIMSYLHRCGLIDYAQPVCATGHFAHVQICVKSGAQFNPNIKYLADKKEKKQECTAGIENRRAVDRTYGNDELLKKELTKEIKQPKIKDICASDDARSSFERFWNIYPRKKDKARALAIWCKLRLWEKEDYIVERLLKQTRHDHQYQTIQFVPYPERYLRNERYEDEITPIKEHPITTTIRELKEDVRQSEDFKTFLLN